MYQYDPDIHEVRSLKFPTENRAFASELEKMYRKNLIGQSLQVQNAFLYGEFKQVPSDDLRRDAQAHFKRMEELKQELGEENLNINSYLGIPKC